MRNRALLVALVVVCAQASADPAAPGVTADSTIVSASFRMDALDPGEMGLAAGFSLEGFLDLGVSFDMGFAPLGGLPARQITVSAYASAAVLRQDATMPVSFILSGSYGRVSYDSPYLDAGSLIRTGSRFGVGADVYRDFAASDRLYVRVGLRGSYYSATDTTESAAAADASTDPVPPRVSTSVSYRYGLLTGVTWVLREGIALTALAFVGLDGDTRLSYGPMLRLASWKPQSSDDEQPL